LRRWLLAAVLLPTAVCRLAAAGDDGLEYKVKAGYLWNFAKFVEWPAPVLPDNAPITICVVGPDPFGDTLESTVRDKTVLGHAFTVRHIAKGPIAAGCHIAFLAYSDPKKLAELAQAAVSSSTLTVGDSHGFVEHGGMIEFTLEHNRIRFDINAAPAKAAGLRISSELLKLSGGGGK
jgi:hypothetical protein